MTTAKAWETHVSHIFDRIMNARIKITLIILRFVHKNALRKHIKITVNKMPKNITLVKEQKNLKNTLQFIFPLFYYDTGDVTEWLDVARNDVP